MEEDKEMAEVRATYTRRRNRLQSAMVEPVKLGKPVTTDGTMVAGGAGAGGKQPADTAKRSGRYVKL